MTTKSAAASASASIGGIGSYFAVSLATQLEDRSGSLRARSHACCGRQCKRFVVEGSIEAVLDRARVERELLAEKVEKVREGVNRGRDEVSLDPRDRRLARPRACRELLLRYSMAPPGVSQQLSGCHPGTISDLMYWA